MNQPSPSPFWPLQTRELRIDSLQIDLHYRRVQRPDGDAELPPRMFELLLLLAAEPHRLHPRAELLQRIWPDVVVEDANLSQSIWMLRKALGEHKGWIRTVAKKGYVFEPPAPVEAIEQLPVTAVCVQDEGPVAATPVSVPRRRRTWVAPALALALAAIAVAAGAWQIAVRPASAPATAASPSITLVHTEDPAVSAEAQLPAQMLFAWLEWKLSALPQLTLLTPAQLAADPSAQASNVVVLLFSGHDAQDPSKIYLRAQFEGASGPKRIQREGQPTQWAKMVDAVSQEVVAELAPAAARQPWPSLQLDRATARQYLALRQARRAHHWVEAVQLGRDLTEQAPGFALGHLQYAESLATLRQLPAARHHLSTGHSLMKRLPVEAGALIDAKLLALSPDHAAAAEAYAELARRHPAQTAFSLQHANALGRMGRFADAMEVLSGPLWTQSQPVAMQVARLTTLSWLQLRLADPTSARASAVEAVRLVEVAGEGWEYERGQTLLALARADSHAAGATRGSPYFEEAAKQFTAAGDKFSALRALFMGEMAAPGAGASRYLDAWLAQTRAAGQQQMELDALRDVAFKHYRAGEFEPYRERLAQAAAVAEAMDDDWGLAALEGDLLNEAYLRGDFNEVEMRVKRIHEAGMQGDMAMWAHFYEGMLAYQRGRFDEAMVAWERGERYAHAGAPAQSSQRATMFACVRGLVLLTRGQPMDARNEQARCGTTSQYSRWQERIATAEIDLASGDRATALASLETIPGSLDEIGSQTGRWGVGIDTALLLTRAGEPDAAAQLLDTLLPGLAQSGYRLLESAARVAAAETALARGQFDAARKQARVAQGLVAPERWGLRYRLRLIDFALLRHEGHVADAARVLAELDHDAHRNGDVLAQVELHGWMTPDTTGTACTADERFALLARTGLRGTTHRWLTQEWLASE